MKKQSLSPKELTHLTESHRSKHPPCATHHHFLLTLQPNYVPNMTHPVISPAKTPAQGTMTLNLNCLCSWPAYSLFPTHCPKNIPHHWNPPSGFPLQLNKSRTPTLTSPAHLSTFSLSSSTSTTSRPALASFRVSNILFQSPGPLNSLSLYQKLSFLRSSHGLFFLIAYFSVFLSRETYPNFPNESISKSLTISLF